MLPEMTFSSLNERLFRWADVGDSMLVQLAPPSDVRRMRPKRPTTSPIPLTITHDWSGSPAASLSSLLHAEVGLYWSVQKKASLPWPTVRLNLRQQSSMMLHRGLGKRGPEAVALIVS